MKVFLLLAVCVSLSFNSFGDSRVRILVSLPDMKTAEDNQVYSYVRRSLGDIKHIEIVDGGADYELRLMLAGSVVIGSLLNGYDGRFITMGYSSLRGGSKRELVDSFVAMFDGGWFTHGPPVGFYDVTISRVVDGNTVHVRFNNGNEDVVRLADIDAPEVGQLFGEDVKKWFEGYVGVGLTLYISGRDYYGRLLGELSYRVYGSEFSTVINGGLVFRGLAWNYKGGPYGDLERAARQKKVGLWSAADPIAPWEWRKGVRPAVKEFIDPVEGSSDELGKTNAPFVPIK